MGSKDSRFYWIYGAKCLYFIKKYYLCSINGQIYHCLGLLSGYFCLLLMLSIVALENYNRCHFLF
jgi:hypothetical protein